MKTAVLFLIFNRPDTTLRVFEAIRQAKPPRLYVAADGPRKDRAGEKEKCEEVRSIIEKVDWDCEVKTLFRNENLGCGQAVSQAITWFFKQEAEGIILEDDILPHPEFFPYCEELLERYREVKEVGVISGRNHLYGVKIDSEDSYYFSSMAHIWGWATWASRWQLYHYEISGYDYSVFKECLKYYYHRKDFRTYWRWIFFMMKNHLIDTWDYQWTISLMMNKMINIVPFHNLNQNIGFGVGATHTVTGEQEMIDYKGTSIYPLTYPSKVELAYDMDEMDCDRNQFKLSVFNYWKYRIKMIVKRLILKNR